MTVRFSGLESVGAHAQRFLLERAIHAFLHRKGIDEAGLQVQFRAAPFGCEIVLRHPGGTARSVAEADTVEKCLNLALERAAMQYTRQQHKIKHFELQ